MSDDSGEEGSSLGFQGNLDLYLEIATNTWQ